jgi:hypothetical protein
MTSLKPLHVSVTLVRPSSGGCFPCLVLLLLLCLFVSSSCLFGMWLYAVCVCECLMYLSVGGLVVNGVDGPGIESQWGRDFPHLCRPALGRSQPPVQWVPGLSRGLKRPGRDADPHPLLVPWSRKGRAIPLLPLWAVRPVQSLNACTRVHFTYLTLHCQMCIP